MMGHPGIEAKTVTFLVSLDNGKKDRMADGLKKALHEIQYIVI